VEFAVAEAEPVVLEADALELAAPPLPPAAGISQPLPLPPEPPKDVASADRAPEPINVVAVEFAAPPLPPGPPIHSEG
jgi:hypothetical protein